MKILHKRQEQIFLTLKNAIFHDFFKYSLISLFLSKHIPQLQIVIKHMQNNIFIKIVFKKR